MVRDDRDNLSVLIAFSILSVLTVILAGVTVRKVKELWGGRGGRGHLGVLYGEILVYCGGIGYVVRVAWYLDVAVGYHINVYNLLEDIPDLALFSAYSTISCLW